jgi:hypothetical protein
LLDLKEENIINTFFLLLKTRKTFRKKVELNSLVVFL